MQKLKDCENLPLSPINNKDTSKEIKPTPLEVLTSLELMNEYIKFINKKVSSKKMKK